MTTWPAFLRAEWRALLLFNYPVPVSLLEPHLPRGTDLDLWDGSPYASLVGFRFQRLRLMSVPLPLHADFVEVNLRFYVRRAVAGEMRHGVVFIRELVASPLVASAAKLTYNEPYARAQMTRHEGTDGLMYGWSTDESTGTLSARPAGAAAIASLGTEDDFMTTRHWGYTRQRNGSTIEYRVEHPRWRVDRCSAARVSGNPAPLFGTEFAALLSNPPASAMYAGGSAVSVSAAKRIA